MRIIHCKLNIEHCKLNIEHCNLNIINCTLNIENIHTVIHAKVGGGTFWVISECNT